MMRVVAGAAVGFYLERSGLYIAYYTQSVLIRNGPIRSTSEILGFLRND